MKTMIHRKSKTPAEKFAKLPTQYQEQFLDLLRAYQPQTAVVEPSVSGIVSKAPKSPSKKPSKPKQLVVKLYNAKTNAHEELSLNAEDYCDMKLFEVINAIREEGFSTAEWSFKIRIPVGL